MKYFYFILFLSFLMINVLVRAAEETLIIELPDVTVEAARENNARPAIITPAKEEDAGVTKSIIKVDPTSRPLSSAIEEIARTAGVSVKRYGGLGDFATVSVRGSSLGQINLYLDGIPLSQSSSFFNLGDISAANLEKIEIYRGQSPARFGKSAIGGVINLVPRQSPGKISASLKFLTGSFGTSGFNLLTTGGGEKYSLIIGVGQLRSRGDFSYRDDNGTPQEDDDDEIKTRKNNELAQLDLFGNVSFWGEWGKIKLAHYYFRKHKGVPGLGSYQSESAHFENEFNQTNLIYENQNLWNDRIGLELKAFQSNKTDAFYDPDGEIGVGTTNNRNLTISTGGSGLLNLSIPEFFQQPTVFFEAVREVYLPSDHLNPEVKNNTISRESTYLVLSDDFQFLAGRLAINPSWRLEDSKNHFSGDVPFQAHLDAPDNQIRYRLISKSLGAAVKPLDWLKIRASVSENYRLPTFTELFGSKGSILGNSDLLPEKSQNHDCGVQLSGQKWWVIDNWLLESSYYLNEVEDLINFEVNSQRTVVARNISKARLEGVEFNGSVGLFSHFNQSLNVTYQQAKDASDIPYYHGNRLPNRPLYEINSRSELYHAQGKIYFDVNQMTRNYLDRANFYQVDNRIVENAGLTFNAYRKKVLISLEVRNLTNNQVEDVAGYPLPGRGYFGSVNINF